MVHPTGHSPAWHCRVLTKSLQVVPRGGLRGRIQRGSHAVIAKLGRGVPLAMHRMNPECLDSDPYGLAISLTILMREEPDDDEEEQDSAGEDEDGDEGYSE